MGLVDFQIMFEKPLPTYFPGEVVNGQLVVNLSSEKKMAKIKVRPHHTTTEAGAPVGMWTWGHVHAKFWQPP